MGSRGFPRVGCAIQSGQCDLRRVEKLVGSLHRDGFDEDSVCRAGDEVTDVVMAGQRRHGFAVSRSGATSGTSRCDSVVAMFLYIGVEDALPCGAAVLDSEAGTLVVVGKFGKRIGFDESELGCGILSHDGSILKAGNRE